MTICCPGPVATGSPEQPRAIYDGTALMATSSSDKGSSKRMSPPRVAQLIGTAAYHRLDECWIARHPVLLMGETAWLVQNTDVGAWNALHAATSVKSCSSDNLRCVCWHMQCCVESSCYTLLYLLLFSERAQR